MPPRHALIELPERNDARGGMIFAQQGDHVPFAVKRFFAIHGVPEGAHRGGHAHREQHQFLVLLAGSVRVIVDNGSVREEVTLDRPNLALHAPPMLWLELDRFSAGAICMVLTSDIYLEADYIRDRAEFLQHAGSS